MYNLEKTISIIKKSISYALKTIFEDKLNEIETLPEFDIEIPAESSHGDLSSNVALVYARFLKMSPREISSKLVEFLNDDLDIVLKVESAGPGFINFFLNDSFFADTLLEIEKSGEKYGDSAYGDGKKVMIEFVSANPTGPMHMGNARGGALGDSLAALMKKTGYDVYKEFYVNDAGNQIEKFGLSLDVRYRQICEKVGSGKNESSIELPEDCYQGQDIIELAREFFDINGDKYFQKTLDERKKALVDFALPKNIKRMQRDMTKYKIIYDNWFYESTLHASGEVDRIIDILTKNGYTYEKDGCIWYKATLFGSEKDEVLRRKNGIPTYFAADIAYHYNKFVTREFDMCIDILGADHHGHVERMKDAMQALGINRDRLHMIILQLVRLVKNGELVRMSKRTGKAIQLSDLIDEVGADAAKFIFNIHEADMGMDFDLDLAVKQDSQNPVYYVQYAHARICSIFRQFGKQFNIDDNLDLSVLNEANERKLIYFMAQYPLEVLRASKSYDPTRLTRYIINLATLFHKFYSSCKVISEDENMTCARLCLCECVKIVIENVLTMFKIDAPESMQQ